MSAESCQRESLQMPDILLSAEAPFTRGMPAGGYGAALSVDQGWAYNLQDRRLSRNVTTNAVSRSDVVAFHSANSTFTRSAAALSIKVAAESVVLLLW